MPQLSDLALFGGPEGGVVEELAVVVLVVFVFVVLVVVLLGGGSTAGSDCCVFMTESRFSRSNLWLAVMPTAAMSHNLYTHDRVVVRVLVLE